MFICFDPDAAPFTDFAADYIAEMSFLGMDKCRLAGKIVKELDCNWKLCVEYIMDLYHVGTLHADTFGSHTNADSADVKLLPRGGMCFTYTSAPATPDGIRRFGKLPWLDDRPDSFAFMGFMQPNTHIIARSDHVRALITLPIAHDRCRITIYSLFPEAHHARPDFAAKADEYHTFMASVLDEDIDMVRSLQRAMASRNFKPGPRAELEKPIHHVLNGLLEQLYGSGPTPAG